MADTETNRLSEIEARLGAIKAEVETLEKLQNLAAQAAGHSASRSEEKEKNEMAREYSFKRAIDLAVTGRREGVEGEFSAIGAEEFQRSGVSVSAHSIKIPSQVFKRDMSVTGGTNGSEGGVNVQTSVGSIIDVLLPKTVLRGLGVQQLSGLVGNFLLQVGILKTDLLLKRALRFLRLHLALSVWLLISRFQISCCCNLATQSIFMFVTGC